MLGDKTLQLMDCNLPPERSNHFSIFQCEIFINRKQESTLAGIGVLIPSFLSSC